MMQTLEALAVRLQEADLLVERVGDPVNPVISDIGFDSRSVSQGGLFLCKGANFHTAYLHQAVAAGAVAWMSDRVQNDVSQPGLVVTDMRRAMAVAADWFFDSPWKKLTMIGVTGTKGKSTTVSFLKKIFDAQFRANGLPAAGLTSSQTIFDGTTEMLATLTTPEAVPLYRYLNNAVENGLTTMIVEVSSQALKYHRVGGIRFDHGIFLNISPDHISDIEHPTFDDYFASKCRLFDVSEHCHLSVDSDRHETLEQSTANCQDVTWFGIHGEGDIRARNIIWDKKGSFFDVCFKDICFPVFLPMHGNFNVENALAAASVALACGVDPAYIAEGLAQARIEGRMEFLHSAEAEPITVLIDYAHNGISFDSVFKTIQSAYPDAVKVVVFGAPGDKAVNRREGLGQSASQWADIIYLTADDPAHEAVDAINHQIVSHFKRKVPWVSIEDRATAIEDAILSAPPRSVVLLLGKGAEREQKMAKGGQPYIGDKSIAQAALEKRVLEGQTSSAFAFNEA